MIRSLQCIVNGKVQGVGFRAWVEGQAQSLGVNGWVRNLADGTVEVLAQGDNAAVQELATRLLAGSTLARVEDVNLKWIEYDKEHSGFEIRT